MIFFALHQHTCRWVAWQHNKPEDINLNLITTAAAAPWLQIRSLTIQNPWQKGNLEPGCVLKKMRTTYVPYKPPQSSLVKRRYKSKDRFLNLFKKKFHWALGARSESTSMSTTPQSSLCLWWSEDINPKIDFWISLISIELWGELFRWSRCLLPVSSSFNSGIGPVFSFLLV